MLSSHNVAFLGFSPLVDQGAASAAINWLLSGNGPKKLASSAKRVLLSLARAPSSYSPLGFQPLNAADRSIVVILLGGSTGSPFAPKV
jgi:hypothetical protein